MRSHALVLEKAQMNIEDFSKSYSDVFQETVRRASRDLGDELFSKISVPQLSYVTNEYRVAPVKVLVMGQETYGVYDTLRGDLDKGEDWYEERLRKGKNEFSAFNFAVGTEVENSPFWRGYQDVVSAFDLPGRSSVAWSNIVKVQLTEFTKGSFSITVLSPEDRVKVVRWQRELAIAELEYLKPDVLIMFTGGLTWVAKHIYATGDRPVRQHQIADLPASSGHMDAAPLDGVVSVFTYHPAALRKAEDKAIVSEHRRRVIEWAKNKVESS